MINSWASARGIDSTEITIVDLLTGYPASNLPLTSDKQLLRVVLHKGIELLLRRGGAAQTDLRQHAVGQDRLNFSYLLKGEAKLSLASGTSHRRDYCVRQGESCISLLRDQRSSITCIGEFECLTISVYPPALAEWMPDAALLLQRFTDEHFCQQSASSAELHTTAMMLANALFAPSYARAPGQLWLTGQSMILLSLIMEQHRDRERCICQLKSSDLQKLMRAKELLLADLTKAPTIITLARETGLSVLKVKRGFRSLFNNSVYGLFQSERMHEARRRLMTNNASVMTVASDLGYSNASHFATAFQKQFGIPPSSLKHRVM